MLTLKKISSSFNNTVNVSTPETKRPPIASKSFEKLSIPTSTPDNQNTPRTSKSLEKVSKMKRKSRSHYRQTTKWFHRKPSNDFLSESSDDDFVSPGSWQNTKRRKIGCKQKIKITTDVNVNTLSPAAKIPAVVVLDQKSPVLESKEVKSKFIGNKPYCRGPNNSAFRPSNVTPEKRFIPNQRKNVGDITCLNAMMGHFNKSMYEMNLAYNYCNVLRDRLSSDPLHNVAVSFPISNMFSDNPTECEEATSNGKEEEITCVPETEEEPTSLDFQN